MRLRLRITPDIKHFLHVLHLPVARTESTRALPVRVEVARQARREREMRHRRPDSEAVLVLDRDGRAGPEQ